MRKILAVILVFCLTVLLVGCSTNYEQISADYTDKNNEEKECNHSYSSATCTLPKTCTLCGETLGESSGHSWSNATCTKPQICTVCGETKGETTAHNYSNATCTKPQTCTVCGETKGKTTAHNYSGATCTSSGKCTVCGAVGNALGHKWTNATCNSAKKCSRCGTTEGKALGHSIGNDGKCTRCGETISIDMNTRIGSPNDCDLTKTLGGFSFYINSADGVKVLWGGKNNSGKTINYYTVNFYFYNAVDDPAYSQITGKTSKSVKMVGPIAPGEDLLVFDVVDYVSACSEVSIGEITLQYSDGTTETGWYGWSTKSKNSFLK